MIIDLFTTQANKVVDALKQSKEYEDSGTTGMLCTTILRAVREDVTDKAAQERSSHSDSGQRTAMMAEMNIVTHATWIVQDG